MSSPAIGIIPRERLTAYQRWELDAFESQENVAPLPVHKKVSALNPSPVTEPVPVSAVVLPTAEQVEQVYEEARQSGYTAGFESGRADADAAARHMAQLMGALQDSLTNNDEAIAREILSLSLAVARQVVRSAITARPELLLPVIDEALAAMPHTAQACQLVVNPEDAALLRTHLAGDATVSAWRIKEDAGIERGGCRAGSSAGEVDATLETRWQRVVATLGLDTAWLA